MKNNFLSDVNATIEAVCEGIELPEGVAEKIKICNATCSTRFGVILRGRMYTFEGWRAVHFSHFTPAVDGGTEPVHWGGAKLGQFEVRALERAALS